MLPMGDPVCGVTRVRCAREAGRARARTGAAVHVGCVQILERGQKFLDGPVLAVRDAVLREGYLEAGRGRGLRQGGSEGGGSKQQQPNPDHGAVYNERASAV